MPSSATLKQRGTGRRHRRPQAAASPIPVTVQEDGSRDGVRLLAVALALTALGVVMVYSTTAVAADRIYGDSTVYLRKQVMWALIAGITCVLLSATDYRLLCRLSGPFLLVLAGLLCVCLFQRGVGGARRWLMIGGLGLQPSELGKIVVCLFLAERLADDAVRQQLSVLVRPLAGLAVVVALVAIAPDFGTSLFLSLIAGLLLVVGGVALRHLLLFGVPVLIGASVLMLTRFDHIKTRIDVFLHPELDPGGKGYQINQALIALGSGGPFGLGLGESRQKLYFLPEDHTDFILAIIGEELGVAGTLLVAALFCGLLVLGVRIAFRAADRRGFLLAFGLTLALSLQGAINVAVVTASVPTKGISLPFVSYGGSNLCVALAAIGILLNVAGQREGPGRSSHG